MSKHRFLRRARASLIVQKLSARAVLERNLINDGDRLLIGLSGGKDSSVLAWALSLLQRSLKKSFSLEAVHIAGGFLPGVFDGALDCAGGGSLTARLEQWGIPLTVLSIPIIERLKRGRKMNCYWCSTQRRTELIKYALENGFNKIALGHHLDDILETFFMNMMSKGVLSTMPMRLEYRKYPLCLIRPLAYIEEREVIACAAEQGLLAASCDCPYANNSERLLVRERLAAFTGGSGVLKRRILASLSSNGRDLLDE